MPVGSGSSGSRNLKVMRLAAFIRENIEPISAEWERFASTLLPLEEFSSPVLRDSIEDMLNEIANDMDRVQSAEQQHGKSEGDSQLNQAIEGPAGLHALARIQMGCTARQLITEFMALRATVIRLWQQPGSVESENESLYDLTRFNEAVDQFLAEASGRYTEETDRSRQIFLGILGHDLRNPLSAISGVAELLLRAQTPDRDAEYATRILTGAGRMSQMIDDLIELTRVRLGSGIPLKLINTSMRGICENVITEMEATYPKRIFQLDCNQELPGEWDEAKMSQALSNLLRNAVQHGAINSPITVAVKSGDDGVVLEVHNDGTAISPHIIPKIFDLLFQGGSNEEIADDDHTASLGLGLYIVKEIVLAHRGTVEVQSSDDDGTTFVVRLPSARSRGA
jgi:signal transduction histidine kinase